MKIYMETRYYIRRSLSSVYKEDIEARCEKHEISEAVYNFYMTEMLSGAKPLKNSDGSISYSRTQNSNECIEDTFTFEEV